jgi:hypothetical protein
VGQSIGNDGECFEGIGKLAEDVLDRGDVKKQIAEKSVG